MAPVGSFLCHELGLSHLRSSNSSRDLYLLIASRFIRMLGFGSIAPILVLYLETLGFSDSRIGLFLSLTLFGDVVLSLLISWCADAVGRRRMLALGSTMMGVSGAVFFFSKNYVVLLLGAIFGVISPSGNEVGPFSAVEVGILSQLVRAEDRVFILVWYQVLGFVGLALGSIWTGSLVTALENRHSTHNAYRFVFLVYAVIAAIKIVLSLCLSKYTELNHPPFPKPGFVASDSPAPSDNDDYDDDLAERRPLIDRTESLTPRANGGVPKFDSPKDSTDQPATLPVLRLLFVCFLFSIDSFASSLIPASYVSYYFKEIYHASLSLITRVLASSALGAVFTSLLAGALAKRIGLVLAMTVTHIPAQVLTGAMAFAPNLASVITLYIARTCISSMDSSVRSALLSAMVPKTARTRFLGIVDVSRTLAAAPGPFVTGRLISTGALRWTFVISGAIKIAYDLALLAGFATTKFEH
ncbi:hypothetical protein JCM1840_001703 [Sporobolomyces johnsonii]